MAICPICGDKIGILLKSKTSDGIICNYCATICPSVSTTSTNEIKEYWRENHKRFSSFIKTSELSSFMYPNETITIDDNHMLFYIGKEKKLKKEPIVYKYEEVDSYELEEVGGKTVTKKKGGITRAIIGGAIAGPAGAIVGAATAKSETKRVGGTTILKVKIELPYGLKTLSFFNTSSKIKEFFDKCMNVNKTKNQSNDEQKQFFSVADELIKLKALLDSGVITSEEFEAKKKQLLSQ
ncbi:MAG TPA: DUF4428 domain-containing protein [Clostridiales bacterium]|nr:DUF4428 domain-containing protein [Clostridiales bacterium]